MNQTVRYDELTFAGVLKPVEQAESLPPWCYTEDSVYLREQERLFRGGWVSVGREDRWQNPGDYVALEVGGTPIIVLRGEDGILRSFANSCRHRGMLLLMPGDGHCERITCPFHGWNYRLDGSLQAAPKMTDAVDFDTNNYGLIEISLAARAGFVFVNLDGRAGGIDDWLGDFEALHRPWSLGTAVTGYRSEFEIRCNWKAYLEVFNEYYHIQKVHPRTVGMLYETPDPPDEVHGNFTTQFGLHKQVDSVGKLDDGAEPLPIMSTLRGKERSGTRYTWIYPSLTFAASVDAIWILEACPQTAERTIGSLTLCFPEETAAREDFLDRAEVYQRRMDVALAEDIEILERQQLGLNSVLVRPGRFSPLLEPSVHAFQAWFANQLI